MKDGRTVLFLGRFQPFHNGHLKTTTWLVEHYEKVYIAIGSAEKSWQPKNPYTAGERWRMIRDSLNAEKIHHVEIFQVDDNVDDFLWVKSLEKRIPSFDAVVANNPYVWTLFKEAGYDGIFTPPYDRKVWSGSNVRWLMAHGPNFKAENPLLQKWENLVSDSVLEYLRAIGGDERVRDLSKEEENI